MSSLRINNGISSRIMLLNNGVFSISLERPLAPSMCSSVWSGRSKEVDHRASIFLRHHDRGCSSLTISSNSLAFQTSVVWSLLQGFPIHRAFHSRSGVEWSLAFIQLPLPLGGSPCLSLTSEHWKMWALEPSLLLLDIKFIPDYIGSPATNPYKRFNLDGTRFRFRLILM